MRDLLFSREEHESALALTGRFIERYHQGLGDRLVFPPIDRRGLRALMAEPFPQDGRPLEALFEELDAVIVPNSTHTAHPRFLPYVQPSPNGVCAYAEAIASTLNQNCNLWTLSPAANAVEQKVVRWFAELFGFGSEAGGLITSGGSMANLIALTAARDCHLGKTARTEGLQGRPSPLVVYTSDQTHSSIDKAMSILGLGVNALRRVPSDDQFRLCPDLLRQAIADDRSAGLAPFCVVANAGTVTTGAVDPMAALSALCRAEGLWLHVDGAYGALAVLSERYRETLSAIGLADSVSLDPHKFLFTAFEAGCLVVRDLESLKHAFSFSTSYLAMEGDADFVHFADHGPQLSRGFKALKVWWSLRHFGGKAYAAVIDRMADLAAEMGALAETRPAFELLAPVTLNCVCFRLKGLTEAQNRLVLSRLVDQGTAFLGPARVKGQFGLRACFLNLRTTTADVVLIMDELARLAGQVTQPGEPRQGGEQRIR